MEKRKTRLIALSAAAAIVFGPGAWHLLRMSWKRHVLERQQRRWEAARLALTKERERLNTDPVYVEGLVRSTFKVAKPGELVVPLAEKNETSNR